MVIDDDNKLRAKGVQKAIVKKDLRHEMYKESLNECKQFRHKQVAIRSHSHQMGVYEQNKNGLGPLGTKKWIADGGITTRAYGHYLIKHEKDAAINADIAAWFEELFGN